MSSKVTWTWTPLQDDAFHKLKEEISSPRVLALYDVEAKTKVCADASSHGLGAVLLQQQQQQNSWWSVAFASRALSETERHYAQIEKEALTLTWAVEKFSEYILGKYITLETDHKPLVPILGNKSLDTQPPRVLRFRLRDSTMQSTTYQGKHSIQQTRCLEHLLMNYPVTQLLVHQKKLRNLYKKSQPHCQQVQTV